MASQTTLFSGNHKDTTDILREAINSVREAELAYCKFIAANDTKATKSHQSGFHIHKMSEYSFR